jgi:hypothetical protein
MGDAPWLLTGDSRTGLHGSFTGVRRARRGGREARYSAPRMAVDARSQSAPSEARSVVSGGG